MIDELFSLHGRVAVVTGGGNGIGAAVASGLARRGADVAVVDRRLADAEQVAAQIRRHGRNAVAVACDISVDENVASMFETVDATLGRTAILINNAAISSHAHPETISLDEWQRVMDVNITGAFLCARHAARRMIPAGSGAIVNIASISAVTSLGRGNFAYGVSKGALVQMTRELAVEWARHGVRVNAILPCQVRTAPLQALIDDPQFNSTRLVERFLQGIPLNRLGEVEDIVGPIVFLASDAAAMVTGVLLPVDGGNLALNAGGNHTW